MLVCPAGPTGRGLPGRGVGTAEAGDALGRDNAPASRRGHVNTQGWGACAHDEREGTAVLDISLFHQLDKWCTYR
jgi:hypothetical protein